MAGLNPVSDKEKSRRRAVALALAAWALGAWAAGVSAQALPAPSRTMYKCTANNVTSYSDKPCLGAERLVVNPSRGVSKLSGTERIGADVQSERRRDMWADALRPISGMNREQYEVFSRRHKLGAAAQEECRRLDPVLLELEAREKTADKAKRSLIQHDLFVLRQRFTQLGC